MSEARELKKAQQQLKEAQHALKVEEAKERRQTEIGRLEWEKEKFKLQLQQEKDHWAFIASHPKREAGDSSEILKAYYESLEPLLDSLLASMKTNMEILNGVKLGTKRILAKYAESPEEGSSC